MKTKYPAFVSFECVLESKYIFAKTLEKKVYYVLNRKGAEFVKLVEE